MKIVFLTPYPLGESPSQRFRFEQYFELLRLNGHTLKVQSFLSYKGWRRLYAPDNTLIKVFDVVVGLARRSSSLFWIPFYDYIFIHREVSPIGPPVFEWIISKVFRKKIIYDFDDAIWMTDKPNENKLEKIIRWRSKVNNICRWADKVSCGNEYLGNFAIQLNSKVIINPTTIDTVHLHNPVLHKKENTGSINIGWTGSHSTLKYLESIIPVIRALEQKYPQLRCVVIANKRPQLNVKSQVFLPWSIESEIKDLVKIDVGLMPLPDDEWSNGKCGFKALQYMALQIPVVASPVGVNVKIIEHGINGFLASSEEEWVNYLSQLIEDDQLRFAMGKRGREKIQKDYSVNSNAQNFLNLFQTTPL